VVIALKTSALSIGSYTGFVTVSAAGAVDAPQTISVTVLIGGDVPSSLDFYVQPGGSGSSAFTTGSAASVSSTTQSGGNWLSVALNGSGTFLFNVPYAVMVSAGSLSASNYTGSVTVSGSSLAADNKTIAVTLHVTTSPIAQATPTAEQFVAVQGGAKSTVNVAINNTGQGTLSISNVTATPASGTWLSAQAGTDGMSVAITADPTGLSPGTYTGTVGVTTNAANSSLSVPVTLVVEAAGPPVAAVGGALNNATFIGGESLAQGDIVALKGDQLISGTPVADGGAPLPTTLGGAQVLLNGTPVPLYYASPGQINFQIPFEAQIGNATLQVVNNGQQGNTISLKIAAAAPRVLMLGIGAYGIITNQDNSFPIPTTAGIPSHPAKVGDILTIYAIGFGPTSPAVADGAGSPTSPLAQVTNSPQVCFGTASPFNPGTCTLPQFAGLAPNFVGLYQINVTIPQGTPSGSNVPLYITTNQGDSNVVQLAVQ
jgi:uncharacterized protein (TIGR03437 family)